MTEPLISICIPTYNGEKYLEQCIRSCIDQSFTDYEIIICDDGSTDRTIEIIESFSNSLRLIKFFRNGKNLGLVGNWNKCIEQARGEWIKFVFQDDYLSKDCLEEFAKRTNKNVPLIVCKRNFIVEKPQDKEAINYYSNAVRTLENTGRYKGDLFSPEVISKIAIENILMNFIAEPPLTFFKKSVIKEVGVFDQELKQICDLEFFLRIATKYGLVYISEKLAAFRIHNNSTTEQNLAGKEYRFHHIEGLLYALKLQTKPEYSTFRGCLSFREKQKLKLYIKYKTYKALKAIRTEDDERLYEEVRQKYQNYFFRSYEIPLMKLLLWMRG